MSSIADRLLTTLKAASLEAVDAPERYAAKAAHDFFSLTLDLVNGASVEELEQVYAGPCVALAFLLLAVKDEHLDGRIAEVINSIKGRREVMLTLLALQQQEKTDAPVRGNVPKVSPRRGTPPAARKRGNPRAKRGATRQGNRRRPRRRTR